MERKRLDLLLAERKNFGREQSKAFIMSGKVLVNKVPVDKPGAMVSEDSEIDLKGEILPYVSRGGLKLEAAIVHYGVNVTNAVCLDVGASTGGFTDCLLQNGARKVYAVDVGYGQLAWKLRCDERVISIERTNIRYIPDEKISEKVDIITIDVSFISLRIVLPKVLEFLNPNGQILCLIKPQFEAGKGKVGKKGVVKDPKLHEEIISSLSLFFSSKGLSLTSVIPSPILGPKGNKEFLAQLRRESSAS